MLEELNLPDDIEKLNIDELKILAKEIRFNLIKTVSKKGGHLASNLGVVELTLALFKVFDFNRDSIVWDVGHQSYIYKMLTGRLKEFANLREFKGLCGFPSREESTYDDFGTGHASTSIAAANGIAMAKALKGDKSYTIAVIGDGALTGGIALEGINNLVSKNNRLIIILNDNEMSIDENIGATSYALSKIRLSKSYNDIKNNISDGVDKLPLLGKNIHYGISKMKKVVRNAIIPSMNMENLGIKYYGPINGHDMEALTGIFSKVKNINKPIMIHIKTKKGKGYLKAMEDPSRFHGVNPFDPVSGKVMTIKGVTYTDIFEKALLNLANKYENIAAISAAMISSTGLKKMKEKFPTRVFDVGIAEQFAVTFAAGLSCKGIKPVVAIYSTFLQRAYDQILHDVCLQKLPVIFAIDRAGIVGKDGATHQGLFDISYLNSIPNMNIIAPINAKELFEALEFAYKLNCPVAIRYPRGNADFKLEDIFEEYKLAKGQIIKEGNDINIIALGTMIHKAVEVANILESKGISTGVINPRFAKPIDKDLLDKIGNISRMIFTLEEGVLSGGFGQNVLSYLNENHNVKVYNIGINDKFVEHGDVNELLSDNGLDSEGIYNFIINKWRSFEEKA